MKRTILVVEDDAEYRRELAILLRKQYHLVEAATFEAGRDAFLGSAPDLVLLDLSLPGDHSGLDLLQEIRQREASIPCVVLSVNEDPQMVVEALQRGATDYLGKDSNRDRLHAAIARALKVGAATRRHQLHLQRLGVTGGGPRDPHVMIGNSPAMRELLREIERIGPTRANVVVRGESGSGKELVARALHAVSGASPDSFIDILVPGVTETLLMDELFGHERGAYTGADCERIGCIETADGGTLMLDEVGELSPQAQVVLLRVLQEKTFRRQGGDTRRPRTSEFRVISTTQMDLDALCKTGDFRRDFLYRLRHAEIMVPPLRDRPMDIPDLVSYFFRRHRERMGSRIEGFTEEAVQSLMTWEYRENNVRELEVFVIELLCRAEGQRVQAPDVERILERRRKVMSPGTDGDALSPGWLEEPHDTAMNRAKVHYQRIYVENALRRSRGIVADAARLSGLPRQSLSRIMKRLGISRKEFRS